MPWFKTNGANLSGTYINVLATQNIATFTIGLVVSKVQEGKNTIKGATQVNGHP